MFSCLNLASQELEISSNKIRYDNNSKITIFEGSVNSKDEKGNSIFSDYAKYNKTKGLVKTTGETRLLTSGGYEVLSTDVTFDDVEKTIHSNNSTQIKDKDGNTILVDMFKYSTSTSIFFSKGNISVVDIKNNKYNFSEIYIDEKKKKIVGSDVKSFLNQKDLLSNTANEPRIFANTMTLTKKINTLEKGIFTYCKNRENEKCPPWTLQSKKIRHDLAKKTIYYDNVVLRIYDFPIFFSPKFSHPDPTVKRRSGLLAPSLNNSNTVGSSFGVPYFWNIADNKDLTFTPKFYLDENPLFLSEYRQDFGKSFLTVESSYTKGYKKKTTKKTAGGRAHFFSKFNMSIVEEEEIKSDLEINLQKVSNNTYFKVYDITTSLVDKDENILTNSIDYTYQNKDFYFGLKPSVYEDIGKQGHAKHEYLLPLSIEKNIMTNEKYGFLDLDTDLRIRNYETNKQINLLVNNFNWKSKKWLNKFGIESYFKSLVKTVNYEARKTKRFKNDKTNSELNTALGYLAKLNLYKNDTANKNFHTLTPKVLLRYAPGHMRDVDKASKLSYDNLYKINKINQPDVIESGLSTSIGFEYKKNKLDKKNNLSSKIISFSAGQVISAEENMKIPSRSSMDQKFSDVVGKAELNANEKISLNYNFSLDQGYKRFNYNEIGTDITFDKAKFNIKFLQEKNHIGDQEFVKSGANFKLNESSELNFSTKRNLLTSSAEFYNLSYNYINDCLKAGIGYRREFYTDRDIEPEDRLMFTISIIPFAEINTAGLAK